MSDSGSTSGANASSAGVRRDPERPVRGSRTRGTAEVGHRATRARSDPTHRRLSAPRDHVVQFLGHVTVNFPYLEHLAPHLLQLRDVRDAAILTTPIDYS
jgi:hypothetical protein